MQVTRMVKVSIGLIGLQNLLGGDFAGVVAVARKADEAGIDMLSITDHVVMGEHLENYPYGPFPMPLDYPWFEPLTVLSAIAGSTSRIKLSCGVLISPLRPAVLLAKQLATLDVMSRGRVEIGIGTGWQREEYDASGIPWDGRFTRMDEQVKVCKLLWSTAPASFSGKTVNFEAIHAYPRPVHPNGIPIWYGIAPTPRNFDRIAELGDGWVPMERRPEVLAGHVDALRTAFAARGRDPASAQVRVGVRPVKAPGQNSLDLEATLAGLGPLIEAGATVIEFLPSAWCSAEDEMPAFFARLAGWRDSVA
jgi:probable F420-dependent oxidoreductase